MTMLAFILMFLFSLPSGVAAAPTPRAVLIVANGGADPVTRGGFDLGELRDARETFRRNGFVVDIASPAGGAAHPSDYDPADTASDSDLASAIQNTLPIRTLDPARYDAVFLIGGSAAMLDFPFHEGLQRFITAAYEGGKVVGGVCHGPAALVNVRLSDGSWLVDGKAVSAFTEEEELAFGSKAIGNYPFVLQRALEDRGASIIAAPMMLVQTARDGRLVTGQNPFSTSLTAEEMIRASGRTPMKRDATPHEITMLVIARLLREEAVPTEESRAADPRLIAAYGSKLLQLDRSEADIAAAKRLLEFADRSAAHPRIRLSLARVLLRLGDVESARTLLKKAALEFPDAPSITGLLREIEGGSSGDKAAASSTPD